MAVSFRVLGMIFAMNATTIFPFWLFDYLLSVYRSIRYNHNNVCPPVPLIPLCSRSAKCLFYPHVLAGPDVTLR
jgi:hypothetical protein